MQSKPWFKSVTIVSTLVGFLAAAANYFHFSIADLVPALTKNLGDYINDTLALAGLVGTIVGRFQASHTITLTPAKARANNAALAAQPFSQAPTAPSGASASTSSTP
jgi:hypothetical protein